MNALTDLSNTIVPKSDQMNAEDLLAGPRTVTVTKVSRGTTEEQPVSVHYEGGDGRPFKPCKTMRKLLILAWGKDGTAWAGRSMTLYCDPKVQFGGQTVGGIRISHLSHIDRKGLAVNLTATRGKKVLHRADYLEVMSLDVVLAAIDRAVNKAGMDAARALAEQLTAEGDVSAARDAYRAKVSALKANTSAPPPPPPLPAEEDLQPEGYGTDDTPPFD